MDDEWTLETTFAGAISQQIGLDLVQRGQGGVTGTTDTRQGGEHVTANSKQTGF